MITIKRILQTLNWIVPECKNRFDDGTNPGNYSDDLAEAIELHEELKQVGEYLFVDLDCIPGFKTGAITKDDISTIIMDALKMQGHGGF